jgi:NADPH-dependent ferric siderophore reductase
LAYGGGEVVSDMHIIYTLHAKQRMVQRKVSPEQVVEAIESPDKILPGDNGEEIAVRRYGIREVRVVYEEVDVDTIVVYTVMKSRVHSWR